jgi:hypothetical protein
MEIDLRETLQEKERYAQEQLDELSFGLRQVLDDLDARPHTDLGAMVWAGTIRELLYGYGASRVNNGIPLEGSRDENFPSAGGEEPYASEHVVCKVDLGQDESIEMYETGILARRGTPEAPTYHTYIYNIINQRPGEDQISNETEHPDLESATARFGEWVREGEGRVLEWEQNNSRAGDEEGSEKPDGWQGGLQGHT